ncbi:cytochrome c3 family protein [Gemmatimonadota bacterium]
MWACDPSYAPTVWSDPQIDHAAVAAGFQLLGVHAGKPCTSCHDAATFEPLFDPADENDCAVCHLGEYEGEHGGRGFPTTCAACHTPTAWGDGTFNHGAISGGFDLIGTHANRACTACHDPATFEPLFDPADANDCVACHSGDFPAQHQSGSYPTDCAACHTPTAWGDGTFNHGAISGGFDLIGAHANRACTACHDPATFEPLFDPADANDCVACHSGDFPAQHQSGSYPTTCAACHTPTAWGDGTFNHGAISGGFDLIGTHANRACTACHDAATFEPLFDPADENDCAVCHLGEYEGEHGGRGFPTTCAACHTPTAWGDGTFNHDGQYFPIFSGKHREEWTSCSTCHSDPDDYSVFTCFNCHKHNQTDMDEDHSEVSGYVYKSPNCLSCHPRGNS